MATYVLCPLSTFIQVMAGATNPATGTPLSGGLIWTYSAGTSTPTPTWTDSTGSVQNANPIQLNTYGQLANVNIYQLAGSKIKIQISTNAGTVGSPVFGTQVGPTFDNVIGVGDVVNAQTVFYGGTDTGSANSYVLTFASTFTSYTNGIVVYWLPSNTNTGASTININALGAINITNPDGSALIAGQIKANQEAVVAISGGVAVLLSVGILTGTFAPTWTGFGGSPPTGTMYYQIQQNQCTLEWTGGQGTSTGTGLSIANMPAITMPVSRSTTYLSSLITMVVDSGAGAAGTITFSASSTMQFQKGVAPPSATGFTNTGTKGLDTGWSTSYLLR